MERIGIELEEAVRIITEAIQPILETEMVTLEEAGGRIAARSYCSQMDNPPFDRSPLDGYAFRSQDVKDATSDAPVKLRVTRTLYAGDWYDKGVEAGEAVRIMTGAPIPPGADCVIRQEETSLCQREPDVVLIPHSMKPYENYCFQGEDTKNGTLLLSKGEVIGSIEQGILASAGAHK